MIRFLAILLCLLTTASAQNFVSMPRGQGPWTPASLSNLHAWYQGNLLTGSNGDPVAVWPDSSGHGRDAVQATGANRATLATGDLTGNVVNFAAASSQYFLLTPSNFYGSATAASAYLVVKINNDPPLSAATTGFWRIGSEIGLNSASHVPWWLDGIIYDGFASNLRKGTSNPTLSLTSYRILYFYSAPNDYGIFINGVLHFSTATNTVGFEPSNSWLGLSDDGVGNAYYINGRMAEVIFTTGKQSTVDQQKTECYLANKWNITLSTCTPSSPCDNDLNFAQTCNSQYFALFKGML